VGRDAPRERAAAPNGSLLMRPALPLALPDAFTSDTTPAARGPRRDINLDNLSRI